MQILIDRVDCHWGLAPVSCFFSYGTIKQFPFILLRLSAGGLSGWGESLHPLSHQLFDRLRQLPGTDAEALLTSPRQGLHRLGNLYELIDIAAHDLLAQVHQQPLHKRMGPAKRTSIPLMPTIFANDANTAAEKAGLFSEQHMRYLKVKLKGDLAIDLSIIRAIRDAAPHIKQCIGDANHGYTIEALRSSDTLAELRAAGLSIIEDPCEAPPRELAALRSEYHPRIMLDMSVRTRRSLLAALDAEAADLINLHPCQQGRLGEAVTRAEICESRGVTVWVGGTGFLGVGSAAYQHLASVIGLAGPCGELSGPHDHGMPCLVASKVQIKNGFAHLADASGHGAEPIFDEKFHACLAGSRTFTARSTQRSLIS